MKSWMPGNESLEDTRAIWAVQDKLALDADEEMSIELKREPISGQEQKLWSPALTSPT